ncbi:unnamed protein product, partial [Heterotrigona itama]
QGPSSNPMYQQGVTSVCVTSCGFLEAEPVIGEAGGGGFTLPHRGSLAPPSGFCSFCRNTKLTENYQTSCNQVAVGWSSFCNQSMKSNDQDRRIDI